MSTLKKNISGLIIVQLISYVIPLLQIPYLTRTLGIELFGIYAYSLALIQVANLVVDFGFNLYFPQLVASGRNSPKQLGVLVYSSVLIKLILLVIVFLLYIILVVTNDTYEAYTHFFLISFLSVIGNCFNFLWLYQGLEKLYIYSRVMIFSKLTTLLLIYVFIKGKEDFNILATINSIQQIVVMLFALLFVFCYLKVKLVTIRIRGLKIILFKSFEFFFSRAFVAIYTSGCALLIGNFGSAAQMAIYSCAEQLYKAAQQVFSPVNQAIYPYMMRTHNYKVFFKFLYGSLAVCFIGCSIGWVWGEQIITLLFGGDFIGARFVLDILLLALLFNTSAVLLGYPALAPLGLSKIANASVIYAGILQVILFILIINLPLNNMHIYIAWSVVASELTVMIIRLIAVKGKRKNVDFK